VFRHVETLYPNKPCYWLAGFAYLKFGRYKVSIGRKSLLHSSHLGGFFLHLLAFKLQNELRHIATSVSLKTYLSPTPCMHEKPCHIIICTHRRTNLKFTLRGAIHFFVTFLDKSTFKHFKPIG